MAKSTSFFGAGPVTLQPAPLTFSGFPATDVQPLQLYYATDETVLLGAYNGTWTTLVPNMTLALNAETARAEAEEGSLSARIDTLSAGWATSFAGLSGSLATLESEAVTAVEGAGGIAASITANTLTVTGTQLTIDNGSTTFSGVSAMSVPNFALAELGSGTVTLVQSAGLPYGGTAGGTVTLAAVPTKGNLVLAAVENGGSFPVGTILVSYNSQTFWLWVADGKTNPSLTVNGGSNNTGAVVELDGADETNVQPVKGVITSTPGGALGNEFSFSVPPMPGGSAMLWGAGFGYNGFSQAPQIASGLTGAQVLAVGSNYYGTVFAVGYGALSAEGTGPIVVTTQQYVTGNRYAAVIVAPRVVTGAKLQLQANLPVFNAGTAVGNAGSIAAGTGISAAVNGDVVTMANAGVLGISANGSAATAGNITIAGAGVTQIGETIEIAPTTLMQGTAAASGNITLGPHLTLSGSTFDAVTGTTLSLSGTVLDAGVALDPGVFSLSGSTLGVPAISAIEGSLASLGTQIAAASSAMHFVAQWDASTNTPPLTSGVGSPGATYPVSVAGTTALDGISQWAVGDKAVFSGVSNTWTKFDGTPTEVLSVVGQVGDVTAAEIAAAIGLSALGQATIGGTGLTLSGTTLALEFGTGTGQVADGGALASLGSTVSEAALITAENVFQKTQAPTVQVLTFGSTITVDLTQGNDAVVTLTASGATFATPSAGIIGASGNIEIWQDTIGGHSYTFDVGWKFGANGKPQPSTAPGAMDLLSYRRNTAGNYSAVLINGGNS